MEKCLEAFENQSSKNFELIIVDDASSDDSFNRLMEYKEKSDLQMTIIHKSESFSLNLSVTSSTYEVSNQSSQSQKPTYWPLQ